MVAHLQYTALIYIFSIQAIAFFPSPSKQMQLQVLFQALSEGLKPSQYNLFLFYILIEALEEKINATMDFINHTRLGLL